MTPYTALKPYMTRLHYYIECRWVKRVEMGALVELKRKRELAQPILSALRDDYVTLGPWPPIVTYEQYGEKFASMVSHVECPGYAYSVWVPGHETELTAMGIEIAPPRDTYLGNFSLIRDLMLFLSSLAEIHSACRDVSVSGFQAIQWGNSIARPKVRLSGIITTWELEVRGVRASEITSMESPINIPFDEINVSTPISNCGILFEGLWRKLGGFRSAELVAEVLSESFEFRDEEGREIPVIL